MRPMPVTKKHHHLTKTSPIPHFLQPRSTTFRMHSTRLHYQATAIGRIRLYTNNNRPRLLKGIHIYPMQRNDRHHRSRRTLRQTCVSPLRPPPKGHLQPQPPIHSHRDEGTVQEPKHQTEYQHRLPPSDRWTIQTNQPMVGTIPADIRKRSTDRLGQMAPSRPIYAQRLAKR